jgi:predicted permease
MAVFRRIANLFRRSSVDREIDAELQSHIALRTEDNIANGMSSEEARRDALVRFGNATATKERVTASDASLSLDGLWRDAGYALRQLRRAPGFAATAILTLALGIGTNIVVFGVLNAVILNPLRVNEPERLYEIVHKEWMGGGPSYPAFEDFRQRNTTFSGIAAAYGMSGAGLSWQNAVWKMSGYDVTGNYFDLLGVKPEIGRFFHENDEHGLNSAPFIVLSDEFWRRAFHADPAMIGATVELNKHPFTVIGVAPREFQGVERLLWPDYWVPIVNEEQIEGWNFLHDRAVTPVWVFGRLKPGVTEQQATEDLNAISGELAKEYPATDKDLSARLIRPGLQGDDGQMVRTFLLGVMTLALLVLVAACANLAGLFAARAADRGRELAMRVALGASRRRLLRQLLTEALLTSLIGGAAGMLCGGLLLKVLSSWQPFGEGGKHLLAAVDARVYLVGLGLSLVSGLTFGMIPARHAWMSSPLQSMKSAPAETTHMWRFAARDLLLGVQIAICTLLVTSSLVAVRGMVRALHAPLGIVPEGATLAVMDLAMVGQDGDIALTKEKQAIDAALRVPGVTAAGMVNYAPLSQMGMTGISIYRPGTTDWSFSNQVLGTRVYPVSPDYLQAAGTRLLSGRNLTWHDDEHSPRVAVVNETFAHRLFGDAPAVGQHFLMWKELYEVVGIAEDGKYSELTEDPQAAIYTSMAQMGSSHVALVVRSHLASNEIAAALQRTLQGVEPGLPLTLRSWPDALGNVLFPARAATAALGIMGMLAAMLSVTGIFGMAAYSVSKRMKELGIRMALGAKRAQVLRAALGRVLLLLATGLSAGMALGLGATRLLAALVYQATPRDPLVLGGAVLAMALIGVVATWIPARQALRINPAQLLREE